MSRAWRADGQAFAYQRAYDDSAKPAGIYLFDLGTRNERYLCPASPFGPTNLSFSPDGSTIAGNVLATIVLINTATGAVTVPFYSHNAPDMPEFHPALPLIAYARGRVFFGEDPDSGSIHLFHVDTGVDSSLRAGSAPLWGSYPRWSPDGERLAYIEAFQSLRVVDVASRAVVTAYSAPSDRHLVSFRWVRSPGRATFVSVTLATHEPEPEYEAIELRWIGRAWLASPSSAQVLRELDVPSPEGRRLLINASASAQNLLVLYLLPWGFPLSTAVQLTRFER